MALHLIYCAVLFAIGSWLLFYGERIQRRITHAHEQLKRTHHASNLFLWVTSRNYELLFRLVGAFLAILAIGFLIQGLMEMEGQRVPD